MLRGFPARRDTATLRGGFKTRDPRLGAKMIERRRAVRFAVAIAVAIACSLLAPAAQAQQAFQRFYPFLIDLKGWAGNQPEGFTLEMPGNSMTTASREYRRGDARFSAQVVTGPAAQGALAVVKASVDIAQGDAHMHTGAIAGLPVARTYTVHDHAGTVLVALGSSAMFSVTFTGLSEDEALALAQQFDWKAIQAELPK